MSWVGVPAALLMIGVVLLDAFEAMILPRRVTHAFRFARFYYRVGWWVWEAVARLIPPGRRRHTFLSVFGPLSMLALFIVWFAGLIAAFALLHWSLDTPISVPPGTEVSYGTYVYFSGTTFFTLGYGDIVPLGSLGRVLSVVEAGLGFGFLAVVISYLPVLYQAVSQREIAISLLDARAGSPPTAGELLRRMAAGSGLATLPELLAGWERWAAEVLESHLSYPVLSFYRSQHDNQSWVATLTVMLDTCALLIAGGDGSCGYQARLTFAMARHAAVDLGLIFQARALPPEVDRLPEAALARLRQSLGTAGLPLLEGAGVTKAMTELRGLYEPFVNALAVKFRFALPPFQPEAPPVDNWQTSAWMRRSPGLGGLPTAGAADEHFD
jgi:hypothetical protein